MLKFTALLLTLCTLAHAEINLIPKPVSLKETGKTFTLTKDTTLSGITPISKPAATYLKNRLKTVAGFDLSFTDNAPTAIAFDGLALGGEVHPGHYTLNISENTILIAANDQAGFFHGAITLLQLMPAQVWSAKTLPNEELSTFPIPTCQITDYPRFQWRGMMLDCSRQFFPKEYVKLFIDRMAQFKLNTFHWHLTDDEGWRIEIKKYPLLTEIGSKRGPGTKIPYKLLPAITILDRSKPQQGFYTQEDIKEIIAYAKARSITVIPEIDVPGHCKAAIIAYPELLQDPNDQSKYRSVQGTPNNTIDPGLESTFIFCENVFAEVAQLFPAKYIHVGGDERPPGAWEKSPAVKVLMEKEGLKNTDEVQSYFFNRIEKILAKLDRKVLGWEEIAHGGHLSRKDTAIMSWRSQNAGIAAAKAGRPAIMAPAQFLYYDLKYIRHAQENGLVWAGITDTKDSYSYNPTNGIPADAQSNVLGVNGCLWGETLVSEHITDFMAWPRMCALAEIAWTPQENRNWDDFSTRLFTHTLPKLDAQNIHYRIPLPSATMNIEGDITINAPFTGAQIRYTTDNSEPTAKSTLYASPFKATVGTPLKMATFAPSGRHSRIIEGYTTPPLANWSPKNTSADFQNVDFDITKSINKPGTYTLTFDYQKGKSALAIKSASFLVNGKQIATDIHEGFSGSKKTNNTYILSVPKNALIEKANKVTLRANMKGDGDTDSHGVISMTYEPLRPTRKVTTNMPHYKHHIPALANDYRDNTWFWLNREPKKDDQLTVTYDEPQTGTISVVTGKPDGHDMLTEGTLQISYDGNTFKNAANLLQGKADFTPPNNKPIKALRLNVDAPQKNTWLIIRELHIQ